ncbi:MAG: VOC family protein [Chloroflexi bacterium]|nr:VOC family protein [Chloroflexota bacterium]
MPNPVVHFEIGAKNPEKSQKFYSSLFGWHIDTNNPMNYGMVDTHSEGNGINGGIGDAQGHAGVTFYVEVDDLQAYLDKAEKLGGRTITPPTDIPGMVSFAVFSDTEGNAIGLVKNTVPS